ncbi:hypothetical protein evm_014904 [Chilo suppressalis]|nr:hypothetical protein evm_014904 [Chilo suppressalis]
MAPRTQSLIPRIPGTLLIDRNSTPPKGGSVQQATALVIHDSYNLNTQENDIAVMVLRANVTLSSRVMVGRLPWSNMVVADNASLVHIGWGHTQMGGNLAQVLNEVTVRKVNHQRCAIQYAMAGDRVFTNMICAGLLGTGGFGLQNPGLSCVLSWLPHLRDGSPILNL